MGNAIELDVRDLRAGGALMLALGVALPLLPGHPGLPCPLRTLTGVPCPLCGMTTSVEETVRMDLGDAVAANPAGIAFVAIALALLVRRPPRLRFPSVLAAAALGVMWLFELHRFSLL